MKSAVASLVFVHLPKTAGTSLRQAFHSALPQAIHLYDYGPDENTTSDLIKKIRYDTEDRIDNLRRHLDSARPVFVMGHVKAVDYAKVFAKDDFITFLREPTDRVLSDYKHFQRHYGFDGSLIEFASRPDQRNKQWHHLNGVDLGEFGFVGISEDFDSEVERLSRKLDVALSVPKLNVAPSDQQVAMDESLRKAVADLNALDYEIYQRALEIHSAAATWPPTHQDISGAINLLDNGCVQGWAVAEGGHRLVWLDITNRGVVKGRICANIFRRDLQGLNISETGIGGFMFDPEDYNIESGEILLSSGDFQLRITLSC